MQMPNPLSPEFRQYMRDLKRDIAQLQAQMEAQYSTLNRLDDRIGLSSTVTSTTTGVVAVPALLTGGNNTTGTFAFTGDFALDRYEGTLPDWLAAAPDTFTVPNILNSDGAPPPGFTHHGVVFGETEDANIGRAAVLTSGAMVYFYVGDWRPKVADEAWEYQGSKIFGLTYFKPDLTVACIVE
jgi:hypothetical protein